MNTISMELHEEQITELQSQIEELESEKHCLEEELEDLKVEYEDLEDKCESCEKALDKACAYIHGDGIDGCPFSYDISTITNEKMKECNMCSYQCISLDELNSSKQQRHEYLKKSIKCWREYFLKGDTENELEEIESFEETEKYI